MKVTLERLPESRVQLDIEVDPERLQQSLEAAYKRLAGRARVPGFRPGKAPRALVERHLGRDRLMNEALDRLVPDVYNEAIKTEDVDAIAQPELDSLELDPVRFKFIVPVRPNVDLGDYRSVRVERQPVEVTDEMVDEQLLNLRRRYALHVPVERGAQWGDVVTMDLEGEAEGDPFVKDEGGEFPLREGTELFVPGLAEAILGMKKGETKSFELAMPDDFPSERLQGKTATFRITVQEVKEEQLPEPDDEFAAQVNADEFPTFQALRDRIQTDLLRAREEEEQSRIRADCLEKIVAGASLDYPKVLVEREIDHVIRDLMGNDQQAYVAHLARVGRTEAEFRESLREAAEIRLRRALVLAKLTEAEAIEVIPDEIAAEVEKLVAPMGDDADRYRQMFGSAEGADTIRRNLQSQKTLARIEAIATGELEENAA